MVLLIVVCRIFQGKIFPLATQLALPTQALTSNHVKYLSKGLLECVKQDVYDPAERSSYPSHSIPCDSRDDYLIDDPKDNATVMFSSYATTGFSMLRGRLGMLARDVRSAIEGGFIPISRFRAGNEKSSQPMVNEETFVSVNKYILVRVVPADYGKDFRKNLPYFFNEFLANREAKLPRIVGFYRIKVGIVT